MSPLSIGPLNILVVDDEAASRELLQIIMTDAGYQARTAASGEEALSVVGEEDFDVVITDLQMPGMDGGALIKELERVVPEVTVVVLTAFGSIESAVEMIKLGAYDYLRKPFDKEDLLLRVEKAAERRRLSREVRELRRIVEEQRQEGEGIIGSSRAMREVLNQVQATARTDFPVVIYGDSGTGKELVARSIHSVSTRREKPFVTVNCSAIPDTLFENELFGHIKGAYTGATESRKGLFAEANGGTIFLDEIGEIPLALQAKLLRVLQEQEIKPVGDTRTIHVDVRLVCATNKDLQKATEAGEFRQDLFYRINVIPIRIPPLRERKDDIPLLANHFLERANQCLDQRKEGFSKEAVRKMLNYPWPGNVRELENKVKQSALLARGDLVEAGDILIEEMEASPLEGEAASATYKEAKARWEKEYLTRLLRRHRGNVSRAAAEAGRYRADFYNLIKNHGIDPNDFRG